MATSSDDPSLSELQRETELTRAELVQTVDALRSRVSDTAEDIKQRVSPTHLKEEVKDYVRNTGQQWFETLERRARENPLQAVAIGAGVAYPAFSLLRAIPAPILLIGAGIALSRMGGDSQSGNSQRGYGSGPASSTGWSGAGTGEGLMDQARGRYEYATDALRDSKEQATSAIRGTMSDVSDRMSNMADRASSSISGATSSIADRVSGAAAAVQDSAAGVGESLRKAGAGAAETVTNAVSSVQQSGLEAVHYVSDTVGRTTRDVQESVGDVIERYPLIVGGVGLAIGAVIAASLPVSRQENRLLGSASDEMKDRARDMVAQGTDAAKEAAMQAYEDVMQLAKQHGVSPDQLRDEIHNIRDKVGKVAGQAMASTKDEGSRASGGAAPSGSSASSSQRTS